MAGLDGFNAEEHDDYEGGSRPPIPNDRYLVMIKESDSTASEDKKKEKLSFTFEVIEGEYKGRKVFTNLNIKNPSEMAVKISKSELASICRAVGIIKPKDTVELHNIPLFITVVVADHYKTAGKKVNEITKYENKKSVAKGEAKSGDEETAPWDAQAGSEETEEVPATEEAEA